MTKMTYFALGTLVGAYVAQNYDIPNVKKEVDKAIEYIKSLEKK